MTKEEFQLCCVAAEQQNKGLEEWATSHFPLIMANINTPQSNNIEKWRVYDPVSREWSAKSFALEELMRLPERNRVSVTRAQATEEPAEIINLSDLIISRALQDISKRINIDELSIAERTSSHHRDVRSIRNILITLLIFFLIGSTITASAYGYLQGGLLYAFFLALIGIFISYVVLITFILGDKD